MLDPFLIAVDLSDLSERTVEYAVRLAVATGNRLDFVHVLPGAGGVPGLRGAAVALRAQIASEERRGVERRLTTLMESVPPPLRGAVRLVEGQPADAICEAAKQGYEMVVLSTNGRNALEQVFLGSVAERVVRRCSIPVLVVR